MPPGKGSRSSGFEIVFADEAAVLVEVVVEFGVDGAELLQRPHLPQPPHGPPSTSEWQMGLLCPVIEPTAGHLPFSVVQLLDGGLV